MAKKRKANLNPTAQVPSEPKVRIPSGKGFRRWFWSRIFSLLNKHGRYLILTGGGCYCAWVIADALKVYAGRQSAANLQLGVALFADIRVAYTVSVTVGITGAALYLRERKLHRETRERLAKRITELELQFDPKRTSSKLTSRGLTREEDE